MKLLLKISSSCFCCFYFLFLIVLFLGDGHIVLTSSQVSNVTSGYKVTSESSDSDFPSMIELIPSSTSPLPPMNKTPRLVLLPANNPPIVPIQISKPNVPKVTPMSKPSRVSTSYPSLSTASKKWTVNSPASHVYKIPAYGDFSPEPSFVHENVDEKKIKSDKERQSDSNKKWQQRQGISLTDFKIPTKYQSLPSMVNLQRHGFHRNKNNGTGIKYGHAGLQMVTRSNLSHSEDIDPDVTIAKVADLKGGGNSSTDPRTADRIPNEETPNEGTPNEEIPNEGTLTNRRPTDRTSSNGENSDAETTSDPWSFQSRVLGTPPSVPKTVTTGTIQDYHEFLRYRNYSSDTDLGSITEPFTGNTYTNVSTLNVTNDHVTDILNRFRGNFTLAQSNERLPDLITPELPRKKLPNGFRQSNFGTYQGQNYPSQNYPGQNYPSRNIGSQNIRGHDSDDEEVETFSPSSDEESAAEMFMRDFDSKYGKNEKWENDLNSSSSDDNKTEALNKTENVDADKLDKSDNIDRTEMDKSDNIDRTELDKSSDQSSYPTDLPPVKLDGIRIRNQVRGLGGHGDHDHIGHDHKGHDHGGHEGQSGQKVGQTVRLSAGEMNRLNSVRINGQGNERPASTLTSKASANLPNVPKTQPIVPNRIPVRGHPKFKTPPPTSTEPSAKDQDDGDPVLIKELPAKNQQPDYQAYGRPEQVVLTENHHFRPPGPQQRPHGYYSNHPHYNPPNGMNNNHPYEQFPGYIIDDSLMQKLTASPSSSQKSGQVGHGHNHESGHSHENGHNHAAEEEQKSSIGSSNDIIGEAEGGGFGAYPPAGAYPPVGAYPPPLIGAPYPLLPPPPLPPLYPGLPVIQTKVTCCKTYYPPPVPPPQVGLPLYPPIPPHIHPHPYHPIGSFPRPTFQSPSMAEENGGNEIGQGHDQGNDAVVGSASGGSNGGMVAKADGGGSYDTSPFLGGTIGPVPGYGPGVIPPGYKFGDSYCFHEPILPHPLYLKQLKLNKLLWPFVLKKKFLLSLG